MESPAVSIIIPSFNAGHVIEKAIQSVFNQTFSSWQLIVVDGASTDNTKQVLQKFSSEKFHFISEKDNGIYDAINKGVGLSKGKWIYVLGADDVIADEDSLQKIFNQPIPESPKLLFGSIMNEDVANKFVPKKHVSRFGKRLWWKNTLHQQSCFYHRSLFEEDKFNLDYSILSDYDFHLGLLNKKIQSQSFDVLVAHCAASGISKRFTPALYKEELRIKRQRLQVFIYILNVPWVWLKYTLKSIG